MAESRTPDAAHRDLESSLLPSEGSSPEHGSRWTSQYGREAVRILPLAGPVCLQSCLAFSANLVSLAFVGHLGSLTLSQAVLGLSCYNVTGVSLLLGLATGMETLCGQAYGARKYALLGTILQRALLITSSAFCLILVLWTQMSRLLKLAGQHPDIVEGAVYFMWLNAPALFCYTICECMKRYLLAQEVVRAPTFSILIAAGMAPIYNWVFVVRLGWGLEGAAAANDCVQLTSLILLVACLIWWECTRKDDDIRTWHGWSWSAFTCWGGYLQLALPSMGACCLEWWLYEGLIIIAGALPDPDIAVAVMGIGFNTTALTYTISLGLSGAASTRVANLLGGGLADNARRAFHTIIVLEVVLMAAVISLGIGFRSQWAHIFSSDSEVVAATARVLPVVFFSELGDGLNGACGGVLRGAGRQLRASIINGITYWGIGLPLCSVLSHKVGLGIDGLWLGLLTTTTITGLSMLVACCCLDWHKEAKRAAELAVEDVIMHPEHATLTHRLRRNSISGPWAANPMVPMLEGLEPPW